MTGAVTTAHDNRTAARQWIDAFNTRDNEREGSARTEGYIAHAPDSMQLPALDGDAWGEFLGSFVEGFPDLHLEVRDAVADEGMTAQRILFTGTHTGRFRGLPPTGRQVRFSGIEINRMVDAKVAEHWFQLDALTLFEQLGLRVVPGPRLVPRLLASSVTRLFGGLRRKGAR
jgi:predicted ester cyclase